MKQKPLLVFPLLLLTACDGSNSGGDKIAKSTFDALQGELDQSKQDNAVLTKANQKLTAEVTIAKTTIVEKDKERVDNDAAHEKELAAKNDEIARKNASIAQAIAEKDAADSMKRDLEKSTQVLGSEKDKVAADLLNSETKYKDLKADYDGLVKKYDAAVKAGKLGADGKSAYDAELKAAAVKLAAAEKERDDFRKKFNDVATERTKAEKARDQAIKERDAKIKELADLRAERDRLFPERDKLAAFVKAVCKSDG